MLQYDVIKKSIYRVIIQLIKGSKGSVISFTPAQLAKKAGFQINAALCSVIRYYLEKELGLECIQKTNRGRRYIISRYNHPDLWKLAKNS